MTRQRVKFLWDLYWENKTCKPKRSIASTSACIWIRHLILKCILTNFYNKPAERVNLLRHPFRIVTFRPQRIYQLMIRPQPVGTLPVPTNLSVMAMVFERIFYDQLYAYLEEHNIICKYQQAFALFTQLSRLSLRPRTLGRTILTAVKSTPLFS